MQIIKNFTVKAIAILCRQCKSMFATEMLSTLPAVTPETQIETDLHRVLPNARFRAALLAMCPACNHTWWTTSFQAHFAKAEFVPAAPQVDHARKFAHAVLTGRQSNAHSLDIALVALNGLWCARESGQSCARWVNLAGRELEKALRDESWRGNRSYYHYIMGEICRQAGYFKGAVAHFGKVGPESRLPEQLVQRQKVQAIAGDSQPARLPPYLVKAIFCPWQVDSLLAKSQQGQVS